MGILRTCSVRRGERRKRDDVKIHENAKKTGLILTKDNIINITKLIIVLSIMHYCLLYTNF